MRKSPDPLPICLYFTSILYSTFQSAQSASICIFRWKKNPVFALYVIFPSRFARFKKSLHTFDIFLEKYKK